MEKARDGWRVVARRDQHDGDGTWLCISQKDRQSVLRIIMGLPQCLELQVAIGSNVYYTLLMVAMDIID